MKEHVCTEDVQSFAGYPVPCDCGHFSSAYVMVYVEDGTSLRVCSDHVAEVLRERFGPAFKRQVSSNSKERT